MEAGGKRYLITGGAGFIGGHLAERLLGDGHRVLVRILAPAIARPSCLDAVDLCIPMKLSF